MSQTQCIQIPLHPDCAEEFVDFARSLGRDPDDIAAILAEEGMLAEAVFLHQTPEETSVIIFTRARDLVAAHEAYLASEHPIQQRMRALSARAFDTSRARVLEVLLDLTGPFVSADGDFYGSGQAQ